MICNFCTICAQGSYINMASLMSVLVGISFTEIFINIEKNVKTFLQFENLKFSLQSVSCTDF